MTCLIKLKPEAIYDLWPVRRSLIFKVARRFKSLSTPDLDDILVTGETDSDHLKNLKEVLTRLDKAGFRLKREKCAFLLTSIDYLGHIVTANGLKPNVKKVQAIENAPRPLDVSQLNRSFIGMMNYYGKFLPNLSTILALSYSLLHKHSRWAWGQEQERAFVLARNFLTSSQLLIHFDPEKELVVCCDALPYGLGLFYCRMVLTGQFFMHLALCHPPREGIPS